MLLRRAYPSCSSLHIEANPFLVYQVAASPGATDTPSPCCSTATAVMPTLSPARRCGRRALTAARRWHLLLVITDELSDLFSGSLPRSRPQLPAHRACIRDPLCRTRRIFDTRSSGASHIRAQAASKTAVLILHSHSPVNTDPRTSVAQRRSWLCRCGAARTPQ